MRHIILLAVVALGPTPILLGDSSDIETWLDQSIIGKSQSQEEVIAFVESRVASVPQFDSINYWDHYSSTLRRNILRNVVLRGRAKTWRDTLGGVEWLETIEGGPGYSIRKLRYEPVPGLWVPALLYVPSDLSGQVPVVMNVNGHDGDGKAAQYKQLRCINQAKRGMLALNVEWLGMGQLRTDGFNHYKMNQLDLCGTSGLAPFYLSMSRGLDILLSHDHADPQRVAVAGLSGGGWQTIFISSLDTRVTLANPVAGYSSFITRAHHAKDLGDSEQTPSDLGAVADYTHLTMLLSPRPALLTYNAKDNCCFESGYALPPLLDAARPIYKLYDKQANLTHHVNDEPGDHNFGKDNREAFYRKLSAHFSPDSANPLPVDEIECMDELKTKKDLHVDLPADNADFHSLAVGLAKRLSKPSILDDAGSLIRLQESRSRLADVVRAPTSQIGAQRAGSETLGDKTATHWRLRVDDQWTMPAVEISKSDPNATTIVVADRGRTSVAKQVSLLVDQGHRVVAIDPFYFGESKIKERDFLYALQIATVGERPLGIQSSQIAAVARWLKNDRQLENVSVAAFGKRSSLIAIIAAALETEAIAALQLHESYGSLQQVIEEDIAVKDAPELFCFGLLKEFDIAQIAALVVPRKVSLHDASPRVKRELSELAELYSKAGTPFEPFASK